MARRTLEGTCADQGATKRVLAENLKDLQAQRKIDGLLAQWADLLRVVGNKGAHFTGEKASAQDAQDALDFAEALPRPHLCVAGAVRGFQVPAGQADQSVSQAGARSARASARLDSSGVQRLRYMPMRPRRL